MIKWKLCENLVPDPNKVIMISALINTTINGVVFHP